MQPEDFEDNQTVPLAAKTEASSGVLESSTNDDDNKKDGSRKSSVTSANEITYVTATVAADLTAGLIADVIADVGCIDDGMQVDSTMLPDVQRGTAAFNDECDKKQSVQKISQEDDKKENKVENMADSNGDDYSVDVNRHGNSVRQKSEDDKDEGLDTCVVEKTADVGSAKEEGSGIEEAKDESAKEQNGVAGKETVEGKDAKGEHEESAKTELTDDVEEMTRVRPATVVTLTSKISEADFDYDLMKPYENDSDDEMVGGGGRRVEDRKVTMSDEVEEERTGRVVFNGGEENCLIDFKDETANITTENNKQEINSNKACKYFEDEDDDDDDDDDILVFDKPISAVSGLIPAQTAEVVLEGIAEEPEDVKDEECDSVITKDDEEDDDENEHANTGVEVTKEEKETYVIREKVFEEEEENDDGKEKGNVCDFETLNDTLESKIKREEESLEKFQLQERQIEEQVELEQQQQQQQQLQQQHQQQTDHHEYVNVTQFSPKLQATSFNDELPTKADIHIDTSNDSNKETPNDTSKATNTKSNTVVSNGTKEHLEVSVEHEASKAVLNEEDFNFDVEKDDHATDEVKGLGGEIKKSTDKGLESYEPKKEAMKAGRNDCKNTGGENLDSNGYEKNNEELATDDRSGKAINGIKNGQEVVQEKSFDVSEKSKSVQKEESECLKAAELTRPAASPLNSSLLEHLPSLTNSSKVFHSSSSTPATPPASRARTVSRTPTCRTPTTPGTPNASSSIRYNDILPEAGCVKALVEQWSRRWSRIDGLEDKGMNRSRSCGPIARKLKLMSPERELEGDSVMGSSMGGKLDRKAGNLDSDLQYNSQPSLTRTMLNKYEKLDQEAAKASTTKKTFKWEVKEPKILKRPTYLPH